MVAVPPFSQQHNLHARDLTILQTVVNNNAVTSFDYYRLGLSMGIPDEVLTPNYNNPSWLEMLVCAKLINHRLLDKEFMCNFLNARVTTDVCQFYHNKQAILPSEKELAMTVWSIPPDVTRNETYFKYALFTFSTCLAALDFTSYLNLYSKETDNVPLSIKLMKMEKCHDLGDCQCDLIVNKLIFQIGIRMDEGKEEGEKL